MSKQDEKALNVLLKRYCLWLLASQWQQTAAVYEFDDHTHLVLHLHNDCFLFEVIGFKEQASQLSVLKEQSIST